MKTNEYGGLLVAIDGPNGVGKSTLIERLKVELENAGERVYCTREPTSTELGDFTRKFSDHVDGNCLACLVAADRYYHLSKEIIPQLKKDTIILTDRYFLSSLVLQRMDNVDADFITKINENILSPDIQFAIIADESTIRARLLERSYLSRFERNDRTNEELNFLLEGAKIISKMGINVIEVNNDEDLHGNAKLMARYIKSLREKAL